MRIRGEMIAEQFRSAPAPMPRSLIDDFLDQAWRHPGRLAVDDSRVRWSYRELLEHSARVAAFLLHHQPVGNRRVLLFAGKSTYSAAAILGTWMAGWAYGCIDEDYPLALAQGARDIIKPDLVLVVNESAEFDPELIKATAGDVPIVYVVELAADIAGVERDIIENGFAACGRGEDIAYFGFTSGTTGRPKTIAMSHRGFLHSIDRHIADFGFNERDRVAVQSSFAFDPAVMDLLSAINMGGVAIMVPSHLYLDGRSWSAYFRRHRITSVMCIPGAMEIGLQALKLGETFTAPRRIIFTGDTIHPHLIRMLHRWMDPNTQIHNAFGLTEAPYLLRGRVEFDRPISSIQFYPPAPGQQVITEQLAEPELSELKVHKSYIFSGYIEELGQISALPLEKGYFKTGDLFVQKDHHFQYIGRSDQRMKWRGHRIEPGEIERILTQCPSVSHALLEQTSSGDLICNIELSAGEECRLGDIKNLLKSYVPEVIADGILLRFRQNTKRKRVS